MLWVEGDLGLHSVNIPDAFVKKCEKFIKNCASRKTNKYLQANLYNVQVRHGNTVLQS